MLSKKERLDILVQRQAGLTRAKAQGLILAGSVVGPNGEVLDKPGVRLPDDVLLDIREGPRYVSRGGLKLEAALEGLHIDEIGRAHV